MFQKLRVTEVHAFFMKEMYWKCAKSGMHGAGFSGIWN
jgi:hypothetical protein